MMETSSLRSEIISDEGCINLSKERRREAILIMMAKRGITRHGLQIYDAEKLIELAISKHGEHLSVGWSGGKCSTVVLHMALKVKPDILVNYNNTGVEFPENVAYVRKLAKAWQLNFHELHPTTNFFDIVKKYGFPQMRSRAFGKKWKATKVKGSGFSQDKRPMCCLLLKEKPVYQFYHDFKVTGDLSGLRAGESRVRAITVGQRGQYYTKKKPYPIDVYLPIALWSRELVDSYLAENNVPQNPIYETQNRNGC
jgi:3'-phosphoadenosine 5'-phosphosulfate sulfotransferase (PAPS reductase)/FAD synthetase